MNLPDTLPLPALGALERVRHLGQALVQAVNAHAATLDSDDNEMTLETLESLRVDTAGYLAELAVAERMDAATVQQREEDAEEEAALEWERDSVRPGFNQHAHAAWLMSTGRG